MDDCEAGGLSPGLRVAGGVCLHFSDCGSRSELGKRNALMRVELEFHNRIFHILISV